jgi:hypothetical protein
MKNILSGVCMTLTPTPMPPKATLGAELAKLKAAQPAAAAGQQLDLPHKGDPWGDTDREI